MAVAGVARARRGDQPDQQWFIGWTRSVADWFALRGEGFGSRSRAQVWFEWRRGGLGLPIVVGLMILFLAILVTVGRHNPRLSPDSPMRSPILLLTVPLLAAALSGGSWGSCQEPRLGHTMPTFLASRPMTCAELVWAKMKAAAISVAVLWCMTLASIVLMVIFTASWGELARQWNVLTKDLSAVHTVAVITLGVVLLPAATWKAMTANMFLGLAGRSWVGVAGVFVIGSLPVAAIPMASWVSTHPEYHHDLLTAVPWALGLAAVLKIVLGVWLVRVVMRRRLIEATLMQRLLAAWLLTAAGLTGLLCWLIPLSVAPWHLLLTCVVLALPLVRVSLAPLALAWNRHR